LPVNQRAEEKVRDVVVKIGDGGAPEEFAVVAGIRPRAIVPSAGAVDATTAESAGVS
jgi:predicted secreted protein